MATSLLCGFEMGSTGESGSPSGTVSVQSTVKRSGTYALRSNPTASTGSVTFVSRTAGGVNRSIFLSSRFYMRIDTLPTAECFISSGMSIVLSRGGVVGAIGIGFSGPESTNLVTADSQWHLYEVSTDGTDSFLYVDGTLWLTKTGYAPSAVSSFSLGAQSVATCDLYFDDLVVFDTGDLGFRGDTRMGLLLPTADPGALNSWTNGGGGTTSIFEGVNNIPPTGVAASTNGVKIKNAASGSNLDYVATMQTYIAGGVPVGSKINAVMALCNDGEEVSTAAKAGGVWIASNPAQAAGGNSFDFGDDVGALGTFATNWRTHYGPVDSAPSVTLSTAPTMTVRKTGSTTRVVDVDFMGIYVDYTPPAVLASVFQPITAHCHQVVSV